MVKIERQGFTLSIDEIEFFIPMSSENIAQLLDLEQTTKKMGQVYEKKLKEVLGNSGITNENFAQTIEIKKEYLTGVYDAILGEGAFEKIYTHHPFVDDLIGTILPITDEYEKQARKFLSDRQKKETQLIEKIKKKKGRK